MSRLKVRFLSPAPRRSKVRFAPTIFLFEKQKNVVARFLAPPLRRKDRSRRLGAFALRAAFSFSFLRLLASLAKGQGQRHSIGWRALRAYRNFSFLIPHCPFRAPPPRKELRSFCVGGVSFCSSVPRLRRVKGQGLLRTSLVRDDVFCFSKNAPPLLRCPPFSALAALA